MLSPHKQQKVVYDAGFTAFFMEIMGVNSVVAPYMKAAKYDKVLHTSGDDDIGMVSKSRYFNNFMHKWEQAKY